MFPLANDHCGYDADMLTSLIDRFKQPSTLSLLCLTTIRSCLRGATQHTSILKSIDTLSLPSCLKTQLSLSDYIDFVDEKETVRCNAEAMYLAMPRKHKRPGNVYVNFWQTTCCFCSTARS